MKMKTISRAIAGLALVVAGSASAFTISIGNYKMTVDSYDAGTLYLGGGSGVICTDIAGCDALGTSNVGSIGSEDTWGIISVAQITNTSTNAVEFSRGADGYLIGTFGGLTDFRVTINDTVQKAWSSGGTVNLYQSATDWNPAIGPSSGRAAVDAAASTGTLYLSADFITGASLSQPTATYVSSFDLDTFHGSGSGYLAYTGGTSQVLFDTNTVMTLSGTFGDASFNTTTGPITPGDVGSGQGWLISNTTEVRGYAIPEPGSMALAGLGLIGLAGLRRRKQQA